MSVLQDLSEEECYLFALFQDYSGIDIVEFCLVDEEFEGGLFRAFPFQYCFAGETEVITKHGYTRIEDLAKLGSAELLSFNDGRSCWVESEVKSFGVQRIVELHLSRRDSRKVIRTTAEHGWFVSHSGGYGLVETKDLSPGMLLQTLDYEDWKVEAVLATDDYEEVFCAVVPESHCFTLADYILTSNCWWRSSDKHQIDQGCLKSDTQILTLNGYVDICDVNVGDLVYTHRHRWRTVTNKFDQGFKQTYRVTVSSGTVQRSIVATSNHQFWVRVDGVEQWLALEDWWKHPGVEVALHSVDSADHVWGSPSNVCAVGVEHVCDLEVFEDHSFVADGVVVHNSRSVGKALDVNTPILTSSGWKLMSSIEVGDVVFNERAEHVTVTDVFDVQFDRPCFEVCFESGASIVADEDHGWVTWSPSDVFSVRHSRSDPGPGSYRTTADIFRSLSEGHFVPRIRSISGFLHAWVNDFDQVVSVERVVSRPVRCISVSGESRLFLAGRGLIPTHNSMSIRYRAVAFPFVHPGAEMLLTAPEMVHLRAITSKIESIYRNNKITSNMVAKRGNTLQIKQMPYFEIVLEGGGSIKGRIPHVDGSALKGVHPTWLEMDEGQDYPEAGWVEANSTIANVEGSMWRCHGVTKGVGGKFDEHCRSADDISDDLEATEDDKKWTVHRLPAMLRPTWSDAERAEAVMNYGSEENVDYRRNVLGLPGSSSSVLFVLSRLMACVDKDETSDYNKNIYTFLNIDDAMINDVDDPTLLLDIPGSHSKWDRFWIGMDVGMTTSPSAIMVFAEEPGAKKDDKSSLRLISRILLTRVSAPDQVKVILHLMDLYRPVAFAMDSTGIGQPLIQILQDEVHKNPELAFARERIKGYTFSSNIVVGLDDTIEIDEYDPNSLKKAEIVRNVKDYSSDVLRELVDQKRLILPFDITLVNEFQAETFGYSKPTLDHYGRRKVYSGVGGHSLDGSRMGALAYKQRGIETFLELQEDNWQPPPTFFL